MKVLKNGDFRYPVEFVSNSAEIHEMTDAEVSSLVDRLNSVIFTNDYPKTLNLTSAKRLYRIFIFTDTSKFAQCRNSKYIFIVELQCRTSCVRPVALKRIDDEVFSSSPRNDRCRN